MVKFLTQPEIEAVLLTALLLVIAWCFRQWRKSRLKLKNFGKSKIFSLRHQLPSAPVNFVGRAEALAELEKKLRSAHKAGKTISDKCVALQGMGGVGKTALATVLAHKLKDYFPDAQLYLNLRGSDAEHRPPVAPAEALQNIIHALHPEVKLPEELDKLTPIYHGIINAAGRVMLFLDNAADANQVKPLLPPANCLLLVTSRSHFSLPGLIQHNIDCLRSDESQELLLKLAPRIKGNEVEAAEHCGHLPLALEVFAGVVNDKKLYPVSDLLKQLREQRDNLAPVDAAFQVSYDLLTDDLRRCWTLLAVFPASFDVAAAAAVWGEGKDGSPQPAAGDSQASERHSRSDAPYRQLLNSSCETMQVLVNASLVEWNEANDRFRLHDLVRQFCDDKLTEAERTIAELHCAGHYRDVAVTAENLFNNGGEDVVRGLALFDHERTNIETTFAWLHSKQDKESLSLLVSLLDTMNHICKLRFYPRQRINWLESQLLASRLLKDRKAECKSNGHLGVAYYQLGDTRKAIEFYNQALAIGREIEYRKGESGALGCLGETHKHLGEIDVAIAFFEMSLAIDREIGDREGEGSNLNYLAGIYADMDNHHRAVQLYEEALIIGRELGDKRIEIVILANLGTTYCQLDDVRKGIKYIQQSLILNREIGDRFSEGLILHKLANSFRQIGNSYEAIEYYEQALQSVREVGDLRGEGWVLGSYSVFLWNDQGDKMKAIIMAEQSLKICDSIEDSNANIVRDNLASWRGQLQVNRVSTENENHSPAL